MNKKKQEFFKLFSNKKKNKKLVFKLVFKNKKEKEKIANTIINLKKTNPSIIPRNHVVEKIINEVINDNDFLKIR